MNALTPTGAAARNDWSYQDMADHFDTLDQYTEGMSHPERVAFLANELSLLGDDDLSLSKKVAWDIIAAWEQAKGIVARVAADRNIHPAFRAALTKETTDA